MCCVLRCCGNNKASSKVRAFKFPNDEDLCMKWVAAIPFFPWIFLQQDIIEPVSTILNSF